MGAPGQKDHLSTLPNEIQTNICIYIPIYELSLLTHSCKGISGNAIRVLYLRNAREENSSAVKFAVLKAHSPDTDQRRLGLEILKRAVSYGANVNAFHVHRDGYATALAIAVASGSRPFVNELLAECASVTQRSRNLLNLPQLVHIKSNFDSMFEDSYPMKRLLRKYRIWLPLFLPMIQRDKDMVKLLVNNGAPASLATPDGRTCGISGRDRMNNLTVHHICALNNDMGLGRAFITRFGHCLDNVLPRDVGTALHISIANQNKDMFDALIAAGADLNKGTLDILHTPLIFAVHECYFSGRLENRKQYMQCIIDLVKAGADVNLSSHWTEGYTPLMAVMDAAEWDWKTSYADMKKLVDLFLEHGARVNHMSNDGKTAARLLVKYLDSGNFEKSQSLEKLLEKLVLTHGADLNMAIPGQESIFMRLLKSSRKKGTTRLLRLVAGLGAIPADHEVDAVLRRWIAVNPIRQILDMSPLKHHLSQQAIDAEYERAFKRHNHAAVDVLVDEIILPSDPGLLVWKAFQHDSSNNKMIERAFRLDFDANWTHRTKGGFLHRIVDALLRNECYKEKDAVNHSRKLIERGTSILLLDSEGKTALQRLREVERPLRDLKLCLHEAKDKEKGEY